MARQRARYRDVREEGRLGGLDAERVAALDGLDFEWYPRGKKEG